MVVLSLSHSYPSSCASRIRFGLCLGSSPKGNRIDLCGRGAFVDQADRLGSSPMASQIRLANTTEHDAAGLESIRWRHTDQLVQTLKQCCVVPHPGGDRFDRGGRQRHAPRQVVEILPFFSAHLIIDKSQRNGIAIDENPRGPRERRQVIGHHGKVAEVHTEVCGVMVEKLPFGRMESVRMSDLRQGCNVQVR